MTVVSDRDYSTDVLAAYGVAPQAILGRGGEATVYALDRDRVLRVLHRRGDTSQLARTEVLLRGLATSAVPFHLPEILEFGEIGGRTYAIERRLPGRSLREQLRTDVSAGRDRLIEAYMDAAWALGDLRPQGWAYYGELATPHPLREPTWREFLAMKAGRSLATAGHPLDRVDTFPWHWVPPFARS